MTTNKTSQNSQGFTLTEILAVLSIISLMTTLSLPPIQSFIRQLNFRNCLRQASQLMRQAQVLARRDYLPHRIILRENKLILQKKENTAWRDAGQDCSPAAGIRIDINQSPVFYPGGAIVPLCTATFSREPKRYSMTISAAGRIRILCLR